MSASFLRGDESEDEASELRAPVALQPVMDLQDRTVFSYVALARGATI